MTKSNIVTIRKHIQSDDTLMINYEGNNIYEVL